MGFYLTRWSTFARRRNSRDLRDFNNALLLNGGGSCFTTLRASWDGRPTLGEISPQPLNSRRGSMQSKKSFFLGSRGMYREKKGSFEGIDGAQVHP